MNTLAFILVLAGLLGLLFALPRIYQICRVPECSQQGWYVLLALVCLFVLGYIGFLWLLSAQNTGQLEMIVAFIFFGGGGFVFLVSELSGQTMKQLLWTLEEKDYQANHDHLTGLPNRHAFYAAITALLASKPGQFACLMMDLDDFKVINDTCGHHVGDLVLVEVAERVSSHVPEGALVARLGGDELAILLPKGEAVDAIALAEMLQDLLKQDIIIGSHRLAVSTSVGIALFPEHGEDKKYLLKHADIAMYYAKRNDKRWQMYEPHQKLHPLPSGANWSDT
ncbi:GGDEF domain-containing protein [Shewanella sedimentimangrovi]|uniref:GGDEF domain-containing protein n=1 Tax=Shewanella sedimentimangrovi TaxID=2814293 RepID=A0ABX7QZV1_9GAMM|nr:GGDEF domain-containing protein [Shewanella sedimentimangrovi]QSX36969.1 GGDEF domain-containing protein [Shewanella sedimentimangrovi]